MGVLITAIALSVAAGVALSIAVGPAFLGIVGLALVAVVVWFLAAGGTRRSFRDRLDDAERPELLGPGGPDDPDRLR
jgi:hypothetical protein